MLRGIDAALAAGFDGTKINMVLIPGVNDGRRRGDGRVLPGRRAWSSSGSTTIPCASAATAGDPLEAERPHACARCNRIRLTADGKLKPCLFSDTEIPVDLADIAGEPEEGHPGEARAGRSCTVRGNWQIGG